MLGSELNLLGYSVFSNKPLPEWKHAYYVPKRITLSSHYSFFFCGQLTESLCFSSVFYKLKQWKPNMVIWIFADAKTFKIFKDNPYVDKVFLIPFEKWKKSRWEKALEDMTNWIHSFQNNVGVVYNFSEMPAAALLATLLGGKKSYGLLMDSEGKAFISGSKWMQYTIEVLYPGLSDGVLYGVNLLTRRSLFLLSLGIKDLNGGLKINPVLNQKQGDFVLCHNECYVAICPCAPYEARFWPIEYWNKVIEQLYCEFKCNILVLLPQDFSPQIDVETFKDKSYIHVLEKLSLDQMAYYIARSRLFLSVHNSYIHLASLLQVPTLVICGERNQGPEFEGLHLSVRRYVPCSPCYSHTCTRRYCLLGLTPEFVFKLVRFLWESISYGDFVLDRLKHDSIWQLLKEELIVEICDKDLPPIMSKYIQLGEKYTDDAIAKVVRLGFLYVWDKADEDVVPKRGNLDLSYCMDWILDRNVDWERFMSGVRKHIKFLAQWEQKLNFLILRLKDSYGKFSFFFNRKKMMVDPDNLWESLVNFDLTLPVLLKKLVGEIERNSALSSEEKIRLWIDQKRVLLGLIVQYRHFLEDFLFSDTQNSDKIQQ